MEARRKRSGSKVSGDRAQPSARPGGCWVNPGEVPQECVPLLARSISQGRCQKQLYEHALELPASSLRSVLHAAHIDSYSIPLI